MSTTNRRSALGRLAAAMAASLLTFAALALPPDRAAAAPTDDDLGAACGLSSGTLTTMLTPDNTTDFVVFGLYDDHNETVATQLVPIYSPNPSAELMVTPIGFSSTVTSAKCLADSPVRRCNDPSWNADEGLIVSLSGMLLGPNYVVAMVGAKFKRLESTSQLSIDGGFVGFQLDKTPVRWSAFFNSEQYVSESFFDIPGGDHTLTLGARDPESGDFVPQERLCFNG